MQPLVSILIPAYNAQEWLAGTIESALAQTWPHKEIVVVDDGSKDNTLAVARQFTSRGVIVVMQKNSGAAAARNKAYSVSQGDFIQWLDADDLLAPEKIEKQLEALDARSNRTLLSSAWGTFTYRPYKAKFERTRLWCDLGPVEWLTRKMGENLSMQTATWLVSRELTDAAGPWDTRLLGDDDGEYFSRVVMKSESIRFVAEAKVFYRRGFSSLSYIGGSNRKLEAQFLSLQLNVGYIRSLDDSPRVRAACVAFLQMWLSAFHPARPDLVEQLQKLAGELGGRLEMPRLPWKYAWIQKLFGWTAARRVQIRYNRIKSSVIRRCDRMLFDWEKRKQSVGLQ
jgi:glycosyltransferase involved in cell wall biosynthesis